MWTKTTENRHGVALWNFDGKVEYGIPLTIGDTVHIEAETEGWFRGYCTNNPSKKGIFPSSHVHVRIPRKKDSLKNLSPDGGSPITQVVSGVLKEWNAILKNKFMGDTEWLEDLRNNMLKLVDHRRQVMSNQLPQEQIREVKADITRCIDWVNMKLGLDLVPNVDGDFIDPQAVSVVELYKVHLASFEQTKTRKPTIIPVEAAVQSQSQRKEAEAFAHHIHFHLKNYACSVGENGEGSEAFFTLYDHDENKCISERFLARFNKHGAPHDYDRLGNITAIFSDISNADLDRNLYLTCHVTRLGPLSQGKRGSAIHRRPHACGVLNIRDLLQLPQDGSFQDTKEYDMKIVTIQDKAEIEFCTLHESIIKKTTARIAGPSTANIGISLSLRILHGHLDQLKINKPLLFNKNLVVARKIGFSDYIVPGDLRNDLFITIDKADFDTKGPIKKSNVEVTFSVVDSKGTKLQCVSQGDGEDMRYEYNSVVYKSITSPRWNETVRLGIPIDNFKDTHIRFEFRHCSTRREEKKLFGLAFMRSMKTDGTAVEDKEHELFVYKCSEHYQFSSPSEYLALPYCSAEVTKSRIGPYGNDAFPRNLKENFYVNTTVCSTKLTQNVDLRCLLAWREHQHTLRDILRRVIKVGGQDIVVVLQDILDALFSILDLKMEEHGRGAFDALVYIVGVLGDTRFKAFTKVMDAYIENDFSSTFAHKSLVYFLKQIIDNSLSEKADFSINMLRSMQYLFKFIFRSHALFQRATQDAHLGDIQDAIRTLFLSINSLMAKPEEQLRGHQMTMLRNFSILSSELQIMYNPEEVSQFLVDMITNMPKDGLPQSILQAKLQCMSGTINSDLFKHQLSRKVLLEPCLEQLKHHIEHKEEYKMCVDILGDILASLHTIGKSESIANEVTIVVRLLLQDSILYLLSQLESGTETNERCIACLLDLLGLMTGDHYKELKESFPDKSKHRDFISKLLKLFRKYAEHTIYRPTWCAMRMRANSLILSASRNLCQDLPITFLSSESRDITLWLDYFRLAVSFITQPSLQLDTFTEAKRDNIRDRFGDMRIEMAQEIVQKWTSLGDYKSLFCDLTRPFLEVTMVRESEIRCAILPIIFDIMCCEKMEKGNFNQLEADLLDKLDTMVCVEKKGDESFTKLFNAILLEHLSSQPWREEGELFVAKVTRLLQRLIDFRQVSDAAEDNRFLRLSCILNLMQFYKDDAGREDIYTRYIYRLQELHMAVQDYTEAAFTLLVLAKNLNFDRRKLEKDDKHPIEMESERKESLYQESIRLLDKGMAWEFGIPLCKELAVQYETKDFDYAKLSAILQTQASFFDHIRVEQRQPEKFYRIVFYGNFSQIRKNRAYIYRGKQFESSLGERLMEDFPRAKIWISKKPPEEKDFEDQDQYIETRLVIPIPQEKPLFKGQKVPTHIQSFYTTNEVQHFKYDRPFNRGEKDKENEFKTLWVERTIVKTSQPLPGLLRWVEIETSETIEIKPILNAVEVMEDKNKDVQIRVEAYRSDPLSENKQFSQVLQGTIEAAVQGGTNQYKKAFMTEEYKAANPDDVPVVQKLEGLIKTQLNICDEGLRVYSEMAPEEMMPMCRNLEGILIDLRNSYGLPNTIARSGTTPARSGAPNPLVARHKGGGGNRTQVMSYRRPESSLPMQSNPMRTVSAYNPAGMPKSETQFYRELSNITENPAIISPSQDSVPQPLSPTSPLKPTKTSRFGLIKKDSNVSRDRDSILSIKSNESFDEEKKSPLTRVKDFVGFGKESGKTSRPNSTASTSSSESISNSDQAEPDPPPPKLPERRSSRAHIQVTHPGQIANQPIIQNHTPATEQPPRPPPPHDHMNGDEAPPLPKKEPRRSLTSPEPPVLRGRSTGQYNTPKMLPPRPTEDAAEDGDGDMPPQLPLKESRTPAKANFPAKCDTPVSLSSQGSTPTNELINIEEKLRTPKTPPPVPSRPRSRSREPTPTLIPASTPSPPQSYSPTLKTPDTPDSPVSRPPPVGPPPPVPPSIENSPMGTPIHNAREPNGTVNTPPIPPRPKSQHRESCDMDTSF